MMANLSTGSLRAPLTERKDDLYETPDVATRALLHHEILPHKIWEPAAGRGAIVNVLRAAGHEVVASDLVDYGVPTHFARRDFLIEYKAPDGCQAIVTNPPFKLVDEFVAHALDLCPRVMMLLRLAFLESDRRREILRNRGLIRVHVFSKRLPMMHRDNWLGSHIHNSAMAFAWFIWDRSRSGPPSLHWIDWEKA